MKQLLDRIGSAASSAPPGPQAVTVTTDLLAIRAPVAKLELATRDKVKIGPEPRHRAPRAPGSARVVTPGLPAAAQAQW